MNIFMLPNFRWIIEEMHRPAVQKGAAWLDEYEPKWISKIVGEKLDLSSESYCICGQLFGSYSERPYFVHEASDFGFNRRGEADDLFEGLLYSDTIIALSYEALDRLWQDEIYWRCNPEVLAS